MGKGGGARRLPRVQGPLPADFESSNALERLRTQLAINEAIGFSPLLRHAYLDRDRTRERCEYGSGTAVEVDMARRTLRVEGVKGLDAKPRPFPAKA